MTPRNGWVLALALAGCGGRTAEVPPMAAGSDAAGPLASVAAEVEAALDRSVDPCTDFYQFACGGWLASTQLPPDRPVYGRGFSTIQDRNQEIVRDILEHPDADADPRLSAFYRACVDTDAVEQKDAAGLKADLAAVAAAKSPAELLRVLVERPLGDAFFGLFVDSDLADPDRYTLHLVQSGLGLPERGYYFPQDDKGKQLLADYEAHVGRMLELAGLDPKGAADVLAVEKALAEGSKAPVELREVEKLHNPTTRAELAKAYPNVPWSDLFAALGVQSDAINVMTPDFFAALDRVLARTALDRLKTYAAWHLVHAGASRLPERFDQENFAFYGRRLAGTPEQRPRWKRCADATDSSLGDLLGKAFVQRAFAGQSKEKAEQMIADIRAAFEEGLAELTWMDDATRERAREKLHAIIGKIGYPDTLETYPGLEVGDDPYANAQAVARWRIADRMAKVGQPVDKTEWFMSPPTVNAYYNPSWNEIVFPAGILQPPFFSADFPDAMNYGAIGMVVGHEITHGFDDEGRKFGPTGRMEEWWDPEVAERFEATAQCIVDIYDRIEAVPGVMLQGKLTQGENIADFGGIKLAHRAFQRRLAQGGPVQTVAGFSPEQLLFVGYAQSWCSLATPEIEELRARTDPHSPPRHRVNVPLANLPAFWEAFECEPGDAMRSEPVCAIW